jgi:hypothetical protein
MEMDSKSKLGVLITVTETALDFENPKTVYM